MDAVLADLWASIIGQKPNPAAGIYKEWAKNPYLWGVPVGAEHTDPKDHMNYQAFTRRIVRWNPSTGVELVDHE